jgi:hypothetical protein
MSATSKRVRFRLVVETEGELIENDSDGSFQLQTDDCDIVILGDSGCYEFAEYIDPTTKDKLWNELRAVRGPVIDFHIVQPETLTWPPPVII